MFLRLYEPYRRLLRLFRFNDRHQDSKRGSSSSSNSRLFDRIHPRCDSRSFSFFLFSHESRWRTRKLRPLESSIGSIKRSILRARQIYEYTDSRRKSGDRTRYQSRTMTNFLFVGKYNVTRNFWTREENFLRSEHFEGNLEMELRAFGESMRSVRTYRVTVSQIHARVVVVSVHTLR